MRIDVCYSFNQGRIVFMRTGSKIQGRSGEKQFDSQCSRLAVRELLNTISGRRCLRTPVQFSENLVRLYTKVIRIFRAAFSLELGSRLGAGFT